MKLGVIHVLHAGLHLALSDPRTLGDVDFTIAHPKFTKNSTFTKKRPKLVLKIFWVRTAHPDEGLCLHVT